MSETLPDKYQTKELPVAVDTIDATEITVTDQEFSDDLSHLGIVSVGAAHVHRMKRIGVFLRGVGTMSAMRGEAFALRQHVGEALAMVKKELKRQVDKRLPNHEAISALGNTVSHLSGKINANLEMMFEQEKRLPVAPKDETERVMGSFEPGQEITPPKSGTLVVAQNVMISNDKRPIDNQEHST